MKKKLLMKVSSICLLTVALASGCSKSNDSDSGPTPPPPPPTPPTPGLISITTPTNNATILTNSTILQWNIANGNTASYWYSIVDNQPSSKMTQFDSPTNPTASVQSSSTSLNNLGEGAHSIKVKACNANTDGSDESCQITDPVTITVKQENTKPVWSNPGTQVNLSPDAIVNSAANTYQSSASVKTYLTSSSQQMHLTFKQSSGANWLNVTTSTGYVYNSQIVPNAPGTTAEISIIATNTDTHEDSDPQNFTVKIAPASQSGIMMSYYSNWTIYNNKLRHGAASFTSNEGTVYPPYGLSGINYQAKSYGNNYTMAQNVDADAQVKLLDIIAYAFAEVYPSYSVNFDASKGNWSPINPGTYNSASVGKVYLSDPWSDLFTQESGSGGLCDTQKISSDPYMHEICLGGYETVISGQTGQPSKTGAAIPDSTYIAAPYNYFFSGNLNQFSQLNKLNSNIKRIVSIGGWYHEDSFEAGAFVNTDNFINSLKVLIDHFNLDGVDLDYEPGYYNTQGYTAANADKFAALIQAVRADFDQTYGAGKKLITIAISPNPNTINIMNGTQNNWAKIAAAVNYISVMGYDMHGAFDRQSDPTAITDFQSNLFNTGGPNDPEGNFNAAEPVSILIDTYKVPASKIILGVPSYARAVQGVSSTDNNGLYQSYSATGFLGDMDSADDTRHEPQGQQSYYSLINDEHDISNMSNIVTLTAWLNNGFKAYSLTNASGQSLTGDYAAWAFGTNSSIVSPYGFASYDTPAVVKTKAQYVQEKQLAGMMMWEMSSDASPSDKQNSLLCSMASVLHSNGSSGTCQ